MNFRDFPHSFPAHSKSAARRYRIRHDCFACPDDAGRIAGRSVLARLPGEGLVVVSGAADSVDIPDSPACRPVYAYSETEPPAVPSGRVFVQAAKGIDLAATLGRLNYAIESVPPYAPHTAWVVASDGTVASALSNLDALIAACGIESAEPQMLRPMSQRSAR